MKAMWTTAFAIGVKAVAGAAQAQDMIRALAPTWVGFAPALVASDLGYHEEEGLEVDFRFEDDRRTCSPRWSAVTSRLTCARWASTRAGPGWTRRLA